MRSSGAMSMMLRPEWTRNVAAMGKAQRLIDLAELNIAGEERRELDPIVGRPTLGIEEHDRKLTPGKLLRGPDAGWTAADHDHRLARRGVPGTRPLGPGFKLRDRIELLQQRHDRSSSARIVRGTA